MFEEHNIVQIVDEKHPWYPSLQDNECQDEPLSDDILETSYDGDGI